MKVEITSKRENPLMIRQELEFKVKEVNATPSRKDVRQQVAALANADEELMVVDVFETSYGTTEFSGKARVYKNQETLRKTELKQMIGRNFGAGEKKKQEEAPAPKEEEKKK